MAYQSILQQIKWPDLAGVNFSSFSQAYMQGKEMQQQKVQFEAQQQAQKAQREQQQQQFQAAQDFERQQVEAKQAEEEKQRQAAQLAVAQKVFDARKVRHLNNLARVSESGDPDLISKATQAAEDDLFKFSQKTGVPFDPTDLPGYPAQGAPAEGDAYEPAQSYAKQQALQGYQQQVQNQAGEASQLLAESRNPAQQGAVNLAQEAAALFDADRPGEGNYDPMIANQKPEWKQYLARAQAESEKRGPKSTVNIGLPSGKQEPTTKTLGDIQGQLKSIELALPQLDEMEKVDKELFTYWNEGKEILAEKAERLGFGGDWVEKAQTQRQDLRTAATRLAATLLYGEAGKQLSDPERDWMMSAIPDIDKMSGTQFKTAAKRIKANALVAQASLQALAGEGFNLGASRVDVKPGSLKPQKGETPPPGLSRSPSEMSDEELEAEIARLRGGQ